MYSCVFWCEFIDLVGFVWLLKAGSPDLVYSKAVCGPKTYRIADFFRPEANFYHRGTAANV